MATKNLIFFIFLIHLCFAGFGQEKNADKIKILNFATFHLSGSSDAISSSVNVKNPEVKNEIEKIVNKLVEFKPTIICVEVPVASSEGINRIYQEFKIDQSNTTNWTEEINSIAFEVGRISGVENIYGIDSKLMFNYPKLMSLAEQSESVKKYINEYVKYLERINEEEILPKFRMYNTEEFKSETLDFYNTLSVMHTPGNYEGAEIIADFYKRNLMIYSNFNDVPKTKEDRVLVILGGTHSAYLDFFMRDHPIYDLVDPMGYLPE
ncbi:DUF5694 domain-containing protein [Salinimicrobium catena]|uniref:DUF5694 domain-containing protein n=1 Tax=Salinimicrobium catena TaxID=390640 RepID=UPI002FE4E9EF